MPSLFLSKKSEKFIGYCIIVDFIVWDGLLTVSHLFKILGAKGEV